ncbi:molybdate ABC transporter substrate-binding protein [Sphingobium sp. Z007]|uniref:molybdate ABC transporter substrate-binding protein n=1 Tax=Sphingobium sp. Z007 TaxID=627495 RepID=UPI0020CB9F9F|nr:molybdate ABC transporter substrate-binding protein [Sphingobium sp. Z007]
MANPVGAANERGPVVLAAASLQDVLTVAATEWARQGHVQPILSFAGSSALARQIQAGAPADLFISADEDWMDVVEKAGSVRAGARADIAGNRLVLVAPLRQPVRLTIGRGMPIARTLGSSRLAMADPDSVPAGRYGKAALNKLGVWTGVAAKLVRAENVRAALALVERGEAKLGVVYATDARASRKVRIVGVFPADSHPPIRYPVARLKSSRHPDAEGFRRFLLSPKGRAVLTRYGFTAP